MKAYDVNGTELKVGDILRRPIELRSGLNYLFILEVIEGISIEPAPDGGIFIEADGCGDFVPGKWADFHPEETGLHFHDSSFNFVKVSEDELQKIRRLPSRSSEERP